MLLRPTHLEIYLNRLQANYKTIADAVAPARVMSVLKANAYGHGIVACARALESCGCPYFGLAYLEEGIRLRKAGVATPILILGGIIGSQIPLFIEYDLTITASSIDKLRSIEETAKSMGKKAKVHLKIDTGMERIGVHYYSAQSFLEYSLEVEHVQIEGIFSHFANADDEELSDAKRQLSRFKTLLSFYETRSLPKPLCHIANSGGALQIPESRLDMVRCGILMYGVYPAPHLQERVSVQLCMRWVSRIVYFKVVRPFHPVSYGSTWQSEEETRIVTIPVGYGDGYPRSMSNRAEVLIRGKRYPIVGRICMDQAMVNIGWDEAYNGEEVILLGSQGNECIKPEELAIWASTITYEILCTINARVPRHYIYG